MIPTGVRKLDESLGGGIPDGLVTDIFGEAGTGKTQLLLQISAISAATGGNVLYIDTMGGFRPERILQFDVSSVCGSPHQSMQVDSELLDRITVSRMWSVSEQLNYTLNFGNHKKYSMIIIDNITDLFSYEYGHFENSKSSISEKNSLFIEYMRKLSWFAITTKTPVVIANMIRTINGTKDVENMKSSIDQFTHIKIHLTKQAGILPSYLTTFTGQTYWIMGKSSSFSYRIQSQGVRSYDILPQS